MVLAVPDLKTAEWLQTKSRAWIANPPSGKGKVGLRVIVYPNPDTDFDTVWLMNQIVERGIARAEDINLPDLIMGFPPTGDSHD